MESNRHNWAAAVNYDRNLISKLTAFLPKVIVTGPHL